MTTDTAGLDPPAAAGLYHGRFRPGNRDGRSAAAPAETRVSGPGCTQSEAGSTPPPGSFASGLLPANTILRRARAPSIDAQLDDVGHVPLEGVHDPAAIAVHVDLLQVLE